MKLKPKHLEAARLIAKGHSTTDVAGLSGMSRGTVYNLQKREDFRAAVQSFRTQKIEAVKDTDSGLVRQSAEDEQALVVKLSKISHTLADAIQRKADHLNELEAEDIPARLLPGLMAALRNAIEVKRQGEDRVGGIEGLLDDLAAIEAAIKEKENVLPFDRSRKSETA